MVSILTSAPALANSATSPGRDSNATSGGLPPATRVRRIAPILLPPIVSKVTAIPVFLVKASTTVRNASRSPPPQVAATVNDWPVGGLVAAAVGCAAGGAVTTTVWMTGAEVWMIGGDVTTMVCGVATGAALQATSSSAKTKSASVIIFRRANMNSS